MKLKKSCSDVDRLYVDESRNENAVYKRKLDDLDDLLGSINDRVSEMVFDSVNIMLESAKLEITNLVYGSWLNDIDPDLTMIRICIEDQSSGGYVNFDFSLHKLIIEQMELVKDYEREEEAREFAKKLRFIADEIENML